MTTKPEDKGQKFGQITSRLVFDMKGLLGIAAPVLLEFMKNDGQEIVDDILSIGPDEAAKVLGAATHDYISTLLVEMSRAKGYPVVQGMVGVRSCVVDSDQHGLPPKDMKLPFGPYKQADFHPDTTFGKLRNCAEMFRLITEAVSDGPMLKLDLMQRMSKVLFQCGQDDAEVER
jgi:hypothetical protein